MAASLRGMATLSNRLQLLLDDERRERLERESERTGAPVSELIRRAIDHVYVRPDTAPGDMVAAEESSAGERYQTGELPHEVRAAVAQEAGRTGRTEREVIGRVLAGVLLRPAPRPGIIDGEPTAEHVDDLLDGFGHR